MLNNKSWVLMKILSEKNALRGIFDFFLIPNIDIACNAVVLCSPEQNSLLLHCSFSFHKIILLLKDSCWCACKNSLMQLKKNAAILHLSKKLQVPLSCHCSQCLIPSPPFSKCMSLLFSMEHKNLLCNISVSRKNPREVPLEAIIVLTGWDFWILW